MDFQYVLHGLLNMLSDDQLESLYNIESISDFFKAIQCKVIIFNPANLHLDFDFYLSKL